MIHSLPVGELVPMDSLDYSNIFGRQLLCSLAGFQPSSVAYGAPKAPSHMQVGNRLSREVPYTQFHRYTPEQVTN